MRRAVGPLLAAATVLAAAGVALASPRGEESAAVRRQNGLYGTLFRGPIVPVCKINEPCDAPAPGVTLIFTRAGAPTVRTKTGADGSYRILLSAGIYTVASEHKGPGREAAPVPRRVKVRLGHVDRLNFFIDTGIR